MARNRNDFLARKILLGMLTASVLYGGAFVSQAEAEEKTLDSGATSSQSCPGDGNTLNLTGGTFESPYTTDINFCGGYNNQTGTANNNTLNVDGTALFKKSNGGTIHIFGGSTVSTIPYEASYNQVKFITGSIYEDGAIKEVCGGISALGQSYKNSVHIASTWDSEHSITQIIGGHSIHGNAKENTIKMEGGKVNNIIGGQSDFGNVTDNEIVITGGTVVGTGAITGGMVSGDKTESITSGNKVSISGATNITTSMIRGGSNYNGTVSKNEVSISSGTLKVDEIIGGHLTSTGKIAEKNSVTITGGVITTGYIRGGIASSGIAKDNHITIGSAATITKGSSTDLRIYGGIAGGTGGRAEGNIITINNNISDVYIYGGSSGADATGNQVIIQGGTINGEILGGWSNKGKATGNTLIIEGGTINSDRIVGGYSDSGEATGNIVELRGAKIVGTVNGGDTYTGTAHDNIIKVYGGDLSEALLNSDKIEIHGKNLNIQHITDFNQLDFYIPKEAVNGDTLVNITGADGTYLADGTKVNAGVETGSNLVKGDTITLLKDEAGITNGGAITGKLTEGVSLEYDLDIAVNSNDITATIKSGGSGRMKPDTKSMVETGMASLALLNESADFIANGVMARAQQDAEAANSSEMTPSFSAGGGKYRLNSGSHVDSKTYNMNLAFAKEVKNSKGKLMFAPFIEYGRGSYDSYLDNGVHGFGNSSFWGIGMMARQTNDDGLYYEGAIHGGNVKSDYNTNSLHDSVGRTPSYDRSNMFYAAHVGIGKVQTIGERNKLDYYGKLFYSHQNSSSAILGTGENYDFGAIDSVRMLLGTKFTHAINDSSSIYAGVAWQQEFSGSAKASWRGMETDAPTLKGATGIMELGYTIKPDNSPVSIDLGINGKIGKQKGFGVNAKFEWSF